MALLAGAGTEHRYQLCRDEYCDRFPCRVYKEGQQDGDSRGYERGFADGLASCPGPHGG